jgi:hypothetical protein
VKDAVENSQGKKPLMRKAYVSRVPPTLFP